MIRGTSNGKSSGILDGLTLASGDEIEISNIGRETLNF